MKKKYFSKKPAKNIYFFYYSLTTQTKRCQILFCSVQLID